MAKFTDISAQIEIEGLTRNCEGLEKLATYWKGKAKQWRRWAIFFATTTAVLIVYMIIIAKLVKLI
jgi:hypothetical protein